MSSEEEEHARTGGKSNKKRRVGRACDMCRQKKVRCDGEEGRRCTNCITFDDECTYIHSAPKRRSRPKGYVERLEQRAAQLEDLLNKICPGFDLLGDFGAAVEESSKIEAEFDESEEDDQLGPGARRTLSASIADIDFSHAIPPSLGSPPPLPPAHMRKDSLHGLSPIPPIASGSQTSLHDTLISATPSVHQAAAEDLIPSDDELTVRHSLGKRLVQLSQRQVDRERDSGSPMSSSSHDVDQASAQSPSSEPRSRPLSRVPSVSSPTGSVTRMPPARPPVYASIGQDKRFFGKSSAFTILKTAVDMKNEYWRSAGMIGGRVDEPEDQEMLSSPEQVSDDPTPVPQEQETPESRLLPCGCPDYGSTHPWVKPSPPVTHIFPHPALMRLLVTTYFDIQNAYVPVLHRPTIERGIKDGRHLREEAFGDVVLLVCALGSRWCTDRTVLLGVGDDEGRLTAQERREHAGLDKDPLGPESVQDDFWREGEDDEEWHSAGWKWFKQVRFGHRALYAPPTLLDLQATCLGSMYLRGSSSPEASRYITGVGLRLAQDLGAHRKKSYSDVPNVEEELMKKAFWSLVWLDWSISPALGRPCGIQHEDFDLDLPIECDDEYWEPADPSSLGFVQPPDKPSKVTFFNLMLRLTQIQAYALRTIYSTSKSRTILGFVGPEWEERTVSELDSTLNDWLDSVPPHLKWDPRNPNTTFLSQSAVLYAAYYALQMTIHRPFIASPRRASSSSFPQPPKSSRFPSLVICTNAARSCVHVSDVLCRRLGQGSHASLGVLHHNMIPLFTSGIVLMLNMWAGSEPHRSRAERNTVKEMKEMADVHKAMDMLKVMEVRWHTAGRLWDMLYELAVVGDLPLPSSSHAAVIRSIKQNRRPLAKVEEKQSGESDSKHASTLPHEKLSRRAASVSEPSRSSSHAAGDSRGRQLPPLDVNVYRTDPVQAWCEYDLTPSVFSQPRAPSTSRETPAQPADPTLDSIFTSQPPVRRKTLGSGELPSARAHPANIADRVDWEIPPQLAASTSAKGKERSRTLDPNRLPNASVNADFAFITMDTARASAAPPPRMSMATNSDIDVPFAHAKPYQPVDTIAQVLDTIQLRHADWPMAQSRDEPYVVPSAGEWSGAMLPGSANGGTMSEPMHVAGWGGEQDVVGAPQETLAMWSSVPESFGWDDWGTYMDNFGTSYPGAPTAAPMGGVPPDSGMFPPHAFGRIPQHHPAFPPNNT